MLSQKVASQEQQIASLREEKVSMQQKEEGETRERERTLENKGEQQNQKIKMLIAEIERLNQVLFSKTEECNQTQRTVSQLEEHVEKQE